MADVYYLSGRLLKLAKSSAVVYKKDQFVAHANNVLTFSKTALDNAEASLKAEQSILKDALEHINACLSAIAELKTSA